MFLAPGNQSLAWTVVTAQVTYQTFAWRSEPAGIRHPRNVSSSVLQCAIPVRRFMSDSCVRKTRTKRNHWIPAVEFLHNRVDIRKHVAIVECRRTISSRDHRDFSLSLALNIWVKNQCQV